MNHFEFRTVPAVEWRRLQGTTPHGTNCARPHFVPVTKRGLRYITIDSTRFAGSSGLCPGEILVDGAWSLAYRFIEIGETAVAEMLLGLNMEVDRYLDALSQNSV
jgi:hypothetical protein